MVGLASIVDEQLYMARSFWSDRRTRTPILIIWVASFGGALHASVTTYFYLEVGASEMEIGYIGFLMSLGAMVLSPFAGFALDTYGPFAPIFVTAGACSAGCLIRGLASSPRGLLLAGCFLGVGVNLWMVVVAHLADCNDRSRRSAVFSAFAVQETTLRLFGKGLFPLWDYLVIRLGIRGTLPRYRIHMGICTVFCFFGLLALIVNRLEGSGALSSQTASLSASSKSPAITVAHPRPSRPADSHTAVTPETTSSSSRVRYAVLIGALLAQSLAFTVVTVLWPLVLKDEYSLTAAEFGLIAFGAAFFSTCSVAAFPAVERRVGPLVTASACAAIAAVASVVAFVAQPSAPPASLPYGAPSNLKTVSVLEVALEAASKRKALAVHCGAAVVLQAALLTLEPSLKSLLSVYVPPHMQGRSLGLMATLGGIGGMGGNIAGTSLYAISKQGHGPLILAKGALPFVIMSALLAVAALALWFIRDGAAALISEVCEPLLPALPLHTDSKAPVVAVASGASTGIADGPDDTREGESVAVETEGSGGGLGLFVRETSYDMKLD